jgi:2'-5' RNA ligase
MRQVRAFIAIPLPEARRRQLAQLQRELAAALPRVRWSAPETIHLTLRFFGDVPEESLEKITEVVLSVGRSFAPFQAELRGVGAFPSPARPRVLWLGVTGAPALAQLHAALDAALRQAGWPGEERPFSPHLTLGRARERLTLPANLLERFRDAGCGPLPVEQLVLYESRLRPTGAIHLPLATIPLGTGR